MPASTRLLQSPASRGRWAGPPHFGSNATCHGTPIVSGAGQLPAVDHAAPAAGRLDYIVARLAYLAPPKIQRQMAAAPCGATSGGVIWSNSCPSRMTDTTQSAASAGRPENDEHRFRRPQPQRHVRAALFLFVGHKRHDMPLSGATLPVVCRQRGTNTLPHNLPPNRWPQSRRPPRRSGGGYSGAVGRHKVRRNTLFG